MRRILVSLILLMIFSRTGYAMFTKDDAGTAGAQFLKLGIGARAVGMGESYAAISDDSTAIYWNPSGLNQINNKSISVMHAVWFEDIFYDWASYVHPLRNGRLGIGIQYLSYGKIDKTDETGLEDGSFTPYDLGLTVSYARVIWNISLGFNLKYISSKIEDESASAIAVDLGGMHKFMENKLSIGLAVQNMGTKMRFINEEDALPFNIKFGGCYNIKKNWLVLLDLNMPVDNIINVCLGSEYCCKINNILNIAGRLGYNTRNINMGGINGITAGFGIKFKCYSIDYAFVPFGNLGNTHRISLTISFGKN